MFRLPENYASEIIAHARAEDPLECCGLLAGKDGRIAKLYHTTNTAASPTRYLMDPKEMLAIFKEMDDNDWEVLAIYHSHTHTQAFPSATDLQLAYWQDPLYLIVSLQDKAAPVLRAFHLRQGNIEEEPLEIVNSQ
ncbi:MAG: M67 family metallopeptidase [Chloroflexi bacterium]|nr:M67 family metallopeptidase [Chloroflexota bacterium]